MTPSVEEVVRKMDDIFLSAIASAIQISGATGINYHTAIKYVDSLRRNYLDAGYEKVISPNGLKRKQKKFEESISLKRTGELDKIPSSDNSSYREKIEQALSHIEMLNPSYRYVIIQRHIEGKTLKDIAKSENVTHQAIEDREKRALKQLKKIIFAEEHPTRIHA